MHFSAFTKMMSLNFVQFLQNFAKFRFCGNNEIFAKTLSLFILQHAFILVLRTFLGKLTFSTIFVFAKICATPEEFFQRTKFFVQICQNLMSTKYLSDNDPFVSYLLTSFVFFVINVRKSQHSFIFAKISVISVYFRK